MAKETKKEDKQEGIPPFLKILQEHDPEFFESVKKISENIIVDALDDKTKTLIWVAIDSVLGKDEGVKALAKKARSLGATDAEIADVVRIVFLGAGLPGLHSAVNAF